MAQKSKSIKNFKLHALWINCLGRVRGLDNLRGIGGCGNIESCWKISPQSAQVRQRDVELSANLQSPLVVKYIYTIKVDFFF